MTLEDSQTARQAPAERIGHELAGHHAAAAHVAELLAQLEDVKQKIAVERLGTGVGGTSPPCSFSRDRLAANRRRLGLSFPQCGRLLGVTWQCVQTWEAGKHRPYPKDHAALAELDKLSKRDVAERLALKAILPLETRNFPPFDQRSFAEHRRRLQLSASQCGRLMQVPYQTVINWEVGCGQPRARYRSVIAAFMTITYEQAQERLQRMAPRQLKPKVPKLPKFDAVGFAENRKRLGLSPSQCGLLLHVGYQTVMNWESGSQPHRSKQTAIHELMNMSPRQAMATLQQRKPASKPKGPPRPPKLPAFDAQSFAANRKRLQLSWAQCGRLLGVGGKTVSDWEKAGRQPHRSKRPAIAELMKLSPDQTEGLPAS